jgi:hypothetical protein
MKYKPGQKVKIKNGDISYNPDAWERLQECNFILTIKKVHDYDASGLYYDMEEETGYRWDEDFIEGLYIEPQDPKELIDSRFDILDL